MVNSHIDSINFCKHNNHSGNFFLLLSNGLKSINQHTSKRPFKYRSSIERDENFVQDCTPDDFCDFWNYHLRYSINSFPNKYFLNQLVKQKLCKT